MQEIPSLHYWPSTDVPVQEVPRSRRDRAVFTLFIVASASLEIFFMIRATSLAMQ